MNEAVHKRYLKYLATAADFYWEGEDSKAIQALKVAEEGLENSVGKPQADVFVAGLDGWLKKWRENILSLFPKESKSYGQSMDFFQELRPPEDSFQSYESDLSNPDQLLPDDELSLVFSLYGDDKIVEAIGLLNNLKEKYHTSFVEYPLVTEIEEDYKDIRKVYESTKDRRDWVKDSKGNIDVFYKKNSEFRTCSFLIEGEIHVPLFNFLVVLYETDLYHLWLPFCTKSFTIANLSRTRKVFFQEYKVPLATTRHTCLYGFGANLLMSDGVVVIISRSCDQQNTFKNVKLPENLKTKRAVVNIIGAIIQPINFGKIHVTLTLNFDPNLKILPNSVLKYFSRKIAKGIYKKIAEIAKNIEETIYFERINSPENKEFYEYLKQSQSEYLEFRSHKNENM